MKIITATQEDKEKWNKFVANNYPPVGAFMQTWEWGDFQKKMGRKTERYFVIDNQKTLALFTLIHQPIKFGLSYGYVPRGPVVSKDSSSKRRILRIMRCIKSWAKEEHSKFVFLRLEPPLFSMPTELLDEGFCAPSYYIQPRFNHTIPVGKSVDEIIANFHSSTRSNINRAKKRGVTIEMKESMSREDFDIFWEMIKDTLTRGGGHNVYPSNSYFYTFVETIPNILKESNREKLTMGIFYGYQNGEPAAANFVLFFGDTATYLFGASIAEKLSSKVTTVLHFEGMREASERGFKYYDLGGIDEQKWPTITTFKRQFHGEEFLYIGNIDIPIRPLVYRAYNLFRSIKKM